MRYLIATIALAVLAGCAITSTSDKPRLHYDRKYNTYYLLRSDAQATKAPSAASYYDHEYNT